MGVLDTFLDAIRLNDDEDDFLDDDLLDEEDDEFLDEEEEVKPRKKFFDRFQKRAKEEFDEEDDLIDEEEEETPVKPSKPLFKSKQSAPKEEAPRSVRASSKITPIRSSRRSSGNAVSMEVCVIKPTSMENCSEIADHLVANSTVIVNLEGIDVELAQRIIDFASGACYSMDGTLQKISSYIFLLGPSQVSISGDLQSILGGSVPSVRTGY